MNYNETAGRDLAQWPQRALGGLIDYVGPGVVYSILARISSALGLIAALALFAFVLYNAFLNGSTGQSIGKKVVGLKLISEETGQPIGGGMGILRYFLHIIDSIICYIGWLFPLWDAKRQTIADKILKTVVINVPK
jgi:uncharacterized RDD family membrane protein YckC